MALQEYETGSQTATIDVEHTLNATAVETTPGVYQFFIDLANMVSGDSVVIRVKEKARSGDTQRVVIYRPYHGAQTEPLFVSPSLHLRHGWAVTLEQTDGTGRAFPWSIRRSA